MSTRHSSCMQEPVLIDLVLLQDNALGSLINKQGSGENGKLDREALLGFQQGRN